MFNFNDVNVEKSTMINFLVVREDGSFEDLIVKKEEFDPSNYVGGHIGHKSINGLDDLHIVYDRLLEGNLNSGIKKIECDCVGSDFFGNCLIINYDCLNDEYHSLEDEEMSYYYSLLMGEIYPGV